MEAQQKGSALCTFLPTFCSAICWASSFWAAPMNAGHWHHTYIRTSMNRRAVHAHLRYRFFETIAFEPPSV